LKPIETDNNTAREKDSTLSTYIPNQNKLRHARYNSRFNMTIEGEP
jgi:hypothetical protein